MWALSLDLQGYWFYPPIYLLGLQRVDVVSPDSSFLPAPPCCRPQTHTQDGSFVRCQRYGGNWLWWLSHDVHGHGHSLIAHTQFQSWSEKRGNRYNMHAFISAGFASDFRETESFCLRVALFTDTVCSRKQIKRSSLLSCRLFKWTWGLCLSRMELIIVLVISCCLTDYQTLSDYTQARIISQSVGWGFGGDWAAWPQQSFWGCYSEGVAHAVSHLRVPRKDPVPRWQARTVGKGLSSSLNRLPVRPLECPHDTAADFSHIQTSKAKLGRGVEGDATSLTIEAMEVTFLSSWGPG